MLIMMLHNVIYGDIVITRLLLLLHINERQIMSIRYKIESLYSYKDLKVGELSVLRAKAQLSREDVAKGIGMSRQTYNRIETGYFNHNFLCIGCFFSE